MTGVERGVDVDPRRWLALAVIAMSTLMVVLDASIVNIALPHAQVDLHISDVDRQWVVTAYTLAFGGLLLLGGRIADYAGRKRIFLVGLAGFATASAVGGFAQDAVMLFAARALQGGFAAMLTPAALSLIAVTFTDGGERARAFGVYGAVAGGGGAVGLILGGVLTEYASWRWCLFVNVPIAVVVLLAAVPALHDRRDGPVERHYDVLGAVLSTGGLVALVYAFTEAAKDGIGWLAPTTLTLLAGGTIMLVAFVVVESRTAHPMLPLSVVADRNRGGAYLVSLLLGAGMFAMLLFLTYYFQVNLGYSPLTSGLAFLPFSGGIIAAAAIASSLLTRVGPKPLMTVGMAMGAAGLFWLAHLNQSSTWLGGVLPPLAVMSLGLGLVFVPLSSLSVSDIESRDTGVASAMLNTSQQIGGALGVALLNTLYASALSRYLSAHHSTAGGSHAVQLAAYLHGYRIAFVVGGCLFTAALVTVLTLIRPRPVDPVASNAHEEPSPDQPRQGTDTDLRPARAARSAPPPTPRTQDR